ncbi:helicase-related protein, partial [Armatimonas sp.]|uniref:helicase-related protein n=1 Tax=Armatimonas sp. TaxID=1872638 RepID=UPI00375181C7
MPEIYDNIQQQLLPTLQATLGVSYRADFCVGYFNLRGWRHLAKSIEAWPGGAGNQCRVLIGMQDAPREELRAALSLAVESGGMDNGLATRLKLRLASELREQLTIGAPTDDDERALRQLATQLKSGQVVVKLFLRHQLHAKLYLLHRHDPINPLIGYLGSSNLTFSGLKGQGELNIDVLDKDAATKLSKWFEERWQERWCLDISKELIEIIEASWAREALIPPYQIYLKMAYHLSQEARAGLTEFRLPKVFEGLLFDYQAAAVKIAARHLHKRGGVLIGDVVGLGKTMMATALTRMFEDDFGLETLILCPKNLVSMWEDYRERYGLRGKVLSITRAIKELPHLRRYRLVLIDESHNLRNREGKVYKAIHSYLSENESRCILLTATPYNKTYIDLSNQLRLFVSDDKDLGIQPEKLLKNLGNIWAFGGSPRTLAAFERSEEPDDWRELMRLYMVRRTRSFIIENYAQSEPKTDRKFLTFADGTRSYFPARVPKTAKFKLDAQFASLYAPTVVDTINALTLPRYGLGNYVHATATPAPTDTEKKLLENLGRAGKRLMGFCRTNLFKRLESSGKAFLLSVERHILRNYLFLHALQNNKPLPIGTQNADLLDTRTQDEDDETGDLFETGEESAPEETHSVGLRDEAAFEKRAAEVYLLYEGQYKRRFKWIAPRFFSESLATHLRADAQALLTILQHCTSWEAGRDEKLLELRRLVAVTYPQEKVLLFTQFADTARYLAEQLTTMGIDSIGCATGGTDATKLAQRFSPVSNNKRKEIKPEQELRVLIATDVLSEGQNLQDARIIVNYDLPWAIIRLIQRAG